MVAPMAVVMVVAAPMPVAIALVLMSVDDCETSVEVLAFTELSAALAAEPAISAVAPTAITMASFFISDFEFDVWRTNRLGKRHVPDCDIKTASAD